MTRRIGTEGAEAPSDCQRCGKVPPEIERVGKETILYLCWSCHKIDGDVWWEWGNPRQETNSHEAV